MDEIDNDGAQEPHQDVQDKEKYESPNSIVMRIIILFDWKMEPSSCFIRHKDSHPKFHRRDNHSRFSSVHEG
jgi:hypothetical protein